MTNILAPFVFDRIRFVGQKMGGPIAPEDVATFGYETAINQLKGELRSNILPIGRIKKGVHAQRAFLFKVKESIFFLHNRDK